MVLKLLNDVTVTSWTPHLQHPWYIRMNDKRRITSIAQGRIFDLFSLVPQKQDRGGQRCVLKPLFHFSFFYNFCIVSLFLSLLPPRRSFLLLPPSSSYLLLLRPSFFLVQHWLNHLESAKGHFPSILTNQPTNGPTNRRTGKASYRDKRTHLKKRYFCKDVPIETMSKRFQQRKKK